MVLPLAVIGMTGLLFSLDDEKYIKPYCPVRMLHVFILIISGLILTGHRVFSQTVLTTDSSSEHQKIFYSVDSGVYMLDSLTVTLTAPEGCTVAFTTNGKEPSSGDDSGLSETEVVLGKQGSGYLIDHRDLLTYPDLSFSFLLDDPSLPSANILRAASVSPAGELGKTETKIYFLNVDFQRLFPDCLVISIVTDPENLLDYDKGILTPGAIYDAWRQTEDGQGDISQGDAGRIQSNITQHGKAWERPCILQIFDGNSTPAAELNAGIRITGGNSRAMNQKSFNLYFRESYGSRFLNYELFPGISRYKSFRLRNGGNNTDWLKFKEAFLTDLVADRDLTISASRKAVLFLNGEYWGPYLLTEKLSGQMLRDHYGVEKKQVVLFKEGQLEDGIEEDNTLYWKLMAFAEKDLSDPDIWQDFKRIMDIRSMADYFAVRIYFGDADWNQWHNDVIWRTRDQSYNEGRWQYILYDVEFSSGLYGMENTAPETDHFRQACNNYPLFTAALRNREFYSLFLDSLREIATVNCDIERVESLLTAYVNEWKPLMPDYYKRFGNCRSQWDAAISKTIDFFRNRYFYILPFVKNFK